MSPIRAMSSTASLTEAHHEVKRAQNWHPENSSPGQSRGPRPLGLRAPVVGAAGGGLEPAFLLHSWRGTPSQTCTEFSEIRVRLPRVPTLSRFGESKRSIERGGGERFGLLAWFRTPESETMGGRDRGDKGRGATAHAV